MPASGQYLENITPTAASLEFNQSFLYVIIFMNRKDLKQFENSFSKYIIVGARLVIILPDLSENF